MAKGTVLGFAALPSGEWLVSSSGLHRSVDGGKDDGKTFATVFP